MVENGELGNVISQLFDNVSMTIDRATEDLAKCFSKSYRVEVQTVLVVLNLDRISRPTYFLWKIQHIRRYSLVAQIISANVSY